MAWWQRSVAHAAGVLFQGTLAPTFDSLRGLERLGAQLVLQAQRPDAVWRAVGTHPAWGRVEIASPRPARPTPTETAHFDPRLEPADLELLRTLRSSLDVRLLDGGTDVLRDRKRLWRWCAALLGDDPGMLADPFAQRLVPRQALDEELAHDAPLDVDALFTIHLVHEGGAEGEAAPGWAHTHGLAELGARDFDVLAPQLEGDYWSVFRALAYTLLEKPELATTRLVQPGPAVSLVPVPRFMADAADQWRALRGGDDHTDDRVVVCDLESTGFFGRLFGRARPTPAALLRGGIPARSMVLFTNAASDLMAERARLTFPVFAALHAEFAALELGFLVKLGYPTDDGASREHLWFEVHACGTDTLEATLVNAPFSVSHLKESQRGTHDVALLSDWTVFTPVGRIDPRSQRLAHVLRRERETIAARLRDGTEA